MDFIKKHFEKMLLALVLIGLITVAIILALKVNNLNEQLRSGSVPRKGNKIDSAKTTFYTNAINSLEVPATWHSNSLDVFSTQIHVPTFVSPVITNTTDPFVLVAIKHKSFRYVFKSYTGNGENIQINELARHRTYFGLKVGGEIADKFSQTGYFIRKFEKKETSIESAVGLRTIDISELTVQHGEDPAVILTFGKVADEKEPEAVVTCVGNNPTAPQTPSFMNPDGVRPSNAGQDLTVRKGQKIDCGGKTYKVIDINSIQVIIMDESNEKQHTYNLPDTK